MTKRGQLACRVNIPCFWLQLEVCRRAIGLRACFKNLTAGLSPNVSPVVEVGILPPGAAAEGLDSRVILSVSAGQDAQLEGKGDARRLPGPLLKHALSAVALRGRVRERPGSVLNCGCVLCKVHDGREQRRALCTILPLLRQRSTMFGCRTRLNPSELELKETHGTTGAEYKGEAKVSNQPSLVMGDGSRAGRPPTGGAL